MTGSDVEGTFALIEVSDMLEVLRGNPHEVVICVSGRIDDRVGAQLARCIGELPKAKRVVVDFSRLDSIHDVHLGAVARELVGLPDLCVRGLGRHHLRLLRYCGVFISAERPRSGEERDG